MVLEQILKGADDFEKTPPLQPYDLDDRFRRLLVFPRDFENALEKAEQIVGGSRAGKEHVQQAILMLGYESLEEILLKIDRAKEVYQLSSDFKAEEIQWVVDHARSRDELNAVLGLQKNDFSIKERIINLSIKAVQFLQANFLPVEILKICGFGFIAEKIFRAIDSGKLTGENVVAFRTLFNSEEQAVLLDRFPEILVKLNLEGRYQQVIPETRAQLIDDYNSAKFILASRGEKIAYDQIGPINLAVLFSLSEDERMALLKNPFIDIWMNRFTEDTLRILETLKKYAKDDYLYFLQNCNDSSLFLVDSREFESGLAVVEKIF